MKITIPHKVCYRSVLIVFVSILLNYNSYAQAPTNDVCASALALTSSTTCTNTAGTLKNATATAGIVTTCGNTLSADVWYSFVAQTTNPTIALSTIATNLRSAGTLIQILSGTCGALTSVSCVTGNAATLSLTPTTLTIGTTYYIRIATNNNSAVTTGTTWTFNICITNLAAATVDYGKSYINITKGTNGGTTTPGDTLEIRATFVVKANTAYKCSFTDVVPANTTYVPGTLRLLTNEGKIYKQFTDASDADWGTLSGSNITINMGAGATAAAGGSVINTAKPSFYGGTCILVASYRVAISSAIAYGTKIPVGRGTLSYSITNGGSTSPTTFPADTLIVYNNYGICANTVGTNAITSEFGGTFGSGKAKNRYPSSKISSDYKDTVFTTNSPNDYYYGISNNTSTSGAGYTTLTTWAIPEATPLHRIFGVEDITGDHTGAASPLLGNPPADTVNSSTGGYMAFINASYRTDTAFLDTITNLCPNTYYQYSAWFRNMCGRCSCDSNGNGAGVSTPAYIPTAPGDSSGVYPNLTYNINGYDYYTTGNILHTGQWIQKGFTYQTGPSETSLIINIRNNAPGGGGNDWAIDDIGVATCSPTVALTPNRPDTICQGSDDTVRFKVSSYFNNYTQYMLEKSTDHGVTWTSTGVDTTGAAATGTGVPVYNSTTGQYEYTLSRYYRLSLTDSLTQYRITVATSNANLSNSNCSAASTTQKLVYGANCGFTLPVNIVVFKGTLKEGFANLQWVSASENPGITYTIERSDDGKIFLPIGTVTGDALDGSGASYSFVDPKAVGVTTYYRINMNINNYHKYTNTILLSNTEIEFDLKALVNPFTDAISFDLTVPADNSAIFSLIDMYGRMVKQDKQTVNKGLNSIRMYNLSNLANGTYTLQVQYTDKIISKRVIKLAK